MSLCVHEISVDHKLVDLRKPPNSLAKLIGKNLDKIR